MLLGENVHPGGEKLTLHLGEKLGLDEQSLVLDVACGAGASAVTLAKRFDCRVVGIDLSEKNLAKAKEKAFSAGLSQQLTFMKSDAETIKYLRFQNRSESRNRKFLPKNPIFQHI